MPKNYIPYDLALILNKKGYVTPSKAYYNIYNKQIFIQEIRHHNEAIWTPTFGEVIDWFKDKYDMDIQPNIESIENGLNSI